MSAETIRVYDVSSQPINWTWTRGFETDAYDCTDGYFDYGGNRVPSGIVYEGSYAYSCVGGGGLLYHSQVTELTNFGTQIFFSTVNPLTGQLEIDLAVAAKSLTCTNDDPCEFDCDYSLATPPNQITWNGSVILSFVAEDAPDDSEHVTLYVYDDAGESVLYVDFFTLPSPIQGYTHPTTGGDGLGWTAGDWIGIRLFLTNNIIRVYFWLYHYPVWTLVYTSPVIDWTANGNARPTLRCPAFWCATAGSDAIHFDTWKYGAGLTATDFNPTLAEFYVEESNIGGGYIVVPEKNINFSSYYTLQETEFYITDSAGNTLFTGMFDHPQLIKDGVRFEIKEITNQLNERVCRRDYVLDSGIVADIGVVP